MQKVYSHENIAIVNSAKNLLALNDIECFLKNEFHASGGHVGFEAVPVELWVHDSQKAEAALAILEKQHSVADDADIWICSGCGEENTGSFETCWNCHKPRPEPGEQA